MTGGLSRLAGSQAGHGSLSILRRYIRDGELFLSTAGGGRVA